MKKTKDPKPTYKFRHLNHYHQLTREQRLIKIGGRKLVADRKMVPLLKALNDAGFRTRSHCYGHETGRAFLSFLFDDSIQVSIHPVREYPRKGKYKPGTMELMLHWKRPKKF